MNRGRRGRRLALPGLRSESKPKFKAKHQNIIILSTHIDEECLCCLCNDSKRGVVDEGKSVNRNGKEAPIFNQPKTEADALPMAPMC